MSTQLTADTNFISVGDYRLASFPINSGVTPYVGSFVYLNAGKIAPVAAGIGGSAGTTGVRVIGQVSSTGTAVQTLEGVAQVRYNGVFEANILSGQTLVAGTIVYLDGDNQLTNTVNGNTVAGIYMGNSPAGNGLVAHNLGQAV